MKRYLIALLLLTSSTVCQAQDVTISRDDGDWKKTRYLYADEKTPESVYRALEHACETIAQPGDLVTLWADASGGPCDQLLVNGITLRGSSRGITLTMSKRHDEVKANTVKFPDGSFVPPAPKGGSIAVSGKTLIENITLKERCWDATEDGTLLSFADGTDFTGRGIVCDGEKDCDWLLYHWSNGSLKFALHDAILKGARQILAFNGTGSKSTYDITLDDVVIFGDANGSRTFGESSSDSPAVDNDPTKGGPDKGGVLGNVVRGRGVWRMNNVRVALTGISKPYEVGSSRWGCPRVAAFTDHFFDKSVPNGLKFEWSDVRVKITDPGIAKQVSDLDFRFNALPAIDNTSAIAAAEAENAKRLAEARGGSGEDGSFKVWEAAK